MQEPLDLLVLGSGVAGLSAAVRAADGGRLRVGVLTKGELDQSTTRWAQGGVAAVLGGAPDSTDLHLEDTLSAGAGLCDPEAARILVDEGPLRVKELIDLGAAFDRDPGGALSLAREGGHSRARVVHAGGAATGREVERALVAAVRRRVAVLLEEWFACDLLVEGGRCVGVTALPPAGGAGDAAPGDRAARSEEEPVEIRARHVLVATGGAGQLFSVTTNPAGATGDGLAMAWRAGAALADLELVQFHPTALHHPARPRPLLSEALRGHGARLLDGHGARFVDELLPRDRVSRAIAEQIQATGVDHVWLDATGLDDVNARFPTIAAALAEVGLDPARDRLPVAPAAHYLCGGVMADLDGASSLPGLWVAGEAAGNGVHGANRLASNSLLDGMVFGARVVEAIERGRDGPEATGAMAGLLAGEGRTEVARGTTPPEGPPAGVAAGALPVESAVVPPLAVPGGISGPRRGDPRRPGEPEVPGSPPAAGDPVDLGRGPVAGAAGAAARAGAADLGALTRRLQRAMTGGAGVVRSAGSLQEAACEAAAVLAELGPQLRSTGGAGRPERELVNLVELGHALCHAALAREETRGAHTRRDHLATTDRWRRRLVLTRPSR